jgi:hypothetical protein
MRDKYFIETIGVIEKKEILSPIGYKNLVLEPLHPFPGYHGTTVPDTDMPKSAFLITKGAPTEEKIVRATQRVKKKHKISFDASPGRVTLFNEMAYCIRIKDIDSYDIIPDIIQYFKEEGITFASNKNLEPYPGIIRITKYFLLEPITDCTLQDKEIGPMKYFQIPFPLDWDTFEKMTVDIKHNIDDPNFDAALAMIYRRSGIIDYIRIYDEKCSKEKLDLIRKKYIQGMKKISS